MTHLSPVEIIAAVCTRFGVCRNDLTGRSKTRNIAIARHVAAYLLREHTHCSLAEIGKLLSKDHSTVLRGAERVAEMVGEGGHTDDDVKAIVKELTS